MPHVLLFSSFYILFFSATAFYQKPQTNVEVKRRIRQAYDPIYEELLTTVKKRKLMWYGDISRTTGLEKTVLQGAVQGRRRRGRQRKRWKDNIAEWTCLRLCDGEEGRVERGGCQIRCCALHGQPHYWISKGEAYYPPADVEAPRRPSIGV